MKEPKLAFSPDLVQLIAEIDEFKGRWEALGTLSPDRLGARAGRGGTRAPARQGAHHLVFPM